MLDTMLPRDHGITVLSLQSGIGLAERICRRLGIAMTRHEERAFDDGEHKIRTLESVRGRDVYLVESLYGDDALSVNDKLVRVLFFAASLRDAGARRVTFIAPYLCYSRKDARTKARDPVATRYMARLFESTGIDRIVTIEVHNLSAYQNAFRIPAEHLSATQDLVSTLAPHVGDRYALSRLIGAGDGLRTLAGPGVRDTAQRCENALTVEGAERSLVPALKAWRRWHINCVAESSTPIADAHDERTLKTQGLLLATETL